MIEIDLFPHPSPADISDTCLTGFLFGFDKNTLERLQRLQQDAAAAAARPSYTTTAARSRTTPAASRSYSASSSVSRPSYSSPSYSAPSYTPDSSTQDALVAQLGEIGISASDARSALITARWDPKLAADRYFHTHFG